MKGSYGHESARKQDFTSGRNVSWMEAGRDARGRAVQLSNRGTRAHFSGCEISVDGGGLDAVGRRVPAATQHPRRELPHAQPHGHRRRRDSHGPPRVDVTAVARPDALHSADAASRA